MELSIASFIIIMKINLFECKYYSDVIISRSSKVQSSLLKVVSGLLVSFGFSW